MGRLATRRVIYFGGFVLQVRIDALGNFATVNFLPGSGRFAA